MSRRDRLAEVVSLDARRRPDLRRSDSLGAPVTPPVLALSPDQAAASLSVSRDYFDQHVAPELRIVRRGRRRLVPVAELERWLAENADFALPPPG